MPKSLITDLHAMTCVNDMYACMQSKQACTEVCGLRRGSDEIFRACTSQHWIAYQLLHALAQVHGRGVCHGDVKCENVLVTSLGLGLPGRSGLLQAHLPARGQPCEWGPYWPTDPKPWHANKMCYLPNRVVQKLCMQGHKTPKAPCPVLYRYEACIGRHAQWQMRPWSCQ